MIRSSLSAGSMDLRFHLIDKTHRWFKMETVPSVGRGGFPLDDRPLDIYLDVEDINRIISTLQTLKENCGYSNKPTDEELLDMGIPFMIDITDDDADIF